MWQPLARCRGAGAVAGSGRAAGELGLSLRRDRESLNSLAGPGSSGSVNPESHSSARISMRTIPTPTSTHPRLTREDVLDGRDVAELLHLPISTVLEYARRGLLPGHKLGRRWIFLRDEIEAAVRSQPGDRSAA